MHTEPEVGDTFPLQAPLTNGEPVWAQRAAVLTKSNSRPNRAAPRAKDNVACVWRCDRSKGRGVKRAMSGP